MKEIPIRKSSEPKQAQIPDGLHPAKLIKTDIYSKSFSWGEGKGIKMFFELEDIQTKYPVNGIFWLQKDKDGYYLPDESIGQQWVNAIMGKKVSGFKRSDLEGRKCMLYIKNKESGAEKKVYPQVEDILPYASPLKVEKSEKVEKKPDISKDEDDFLSDDKNVQQESDKLSEDEF